MRIAAFVILLIHATVSAVPAIAASAGTTGHISARVAETLRILSRTPLHFGHILPGSGAGTVVVTPENTRQATGAVRLSPGGYKHASFLVHGSPNRFYSIHAPARLAVVGTPPLTARRLTNVLQATDFQTYSRNIRDVTTTGRLDNVGHDTIFLGATLIVPDNVAPGHYSANVPLTVSY